MVQLDTILVISVATCIMLQLKHSLSGFKIGVLQDQLPAGVKIFRYKFGVRKSLFQFHFVHLSGWMKALQETLKRVQTRRVNF